MDNQTTAEGVPSNKKKRNKVRTMMALYIVGMVLVLSAHNALRNLQSSLNVEGGLGTASLAANTGTSILFGVLIAPILMPQIQAKHGVVFADTTFLLYAAANFYPEYFTLIPASIFGGIGMILFWICAAQYNLFFAYQYVSLGKQNLHEYVGHISGYFFCGYLSTQLFGNLIPYAVFELSASYESSHNTMEAGINVTEAVNDTEQFSVADYCGVNDCQDIAGGDNSQYHPASQAALYYVMAIFVAMNVIGLVLHVIFLPSLGTENLAEDACRREEEVYDNEAYLPGETDVVPKAVCELDDDICSVNVRGDNNNEDDKIDYDTNNNDLKSDNIQDEEPKDDEKKKEAKEKFKDSWNKLKELWAFYFNPMELLLTPSYLLLGMNAGFAATEITRGFVSCIFGVAEVGLCMAIYGATSLLSALLCGKILAKFARVYPIYFAYALNLAVYLFCLLWVPSKTSGIGTMFGLLAAYGIVDGTYQTFNPAIVPQVFPDETDKAYNCWATITIFGYFLVFAWSTSLCMEQKIYANITMLALAAVTYGIVEYVLRAREKLRTREAAELKEQDAI